MTDVVDEEEKVPADKSGSSIPEELRVTTKEADEIAAEVEADKAKTADKSKASGKRLSAEQWTEIITHYEFGSMNLKEIIEKYGISSSAIHKFFKRRATEGRPVIRNSRRHLFHVVGGPASAPAISAAAAAAMAETFATKRKKRIEESKESLFTLSAVNQALLGKIVRELRDPSAPVAPAARMADIKALRQIELTIADMMDNRYRILNIEDDVDQVELPKLVLEDLSQEEIKDIQRRAGGEDDEDDDLSLMDDPDEIVSESGIE